MYIKKITYVGYFGMDYKLETSQISAKENFIKEIQVSKDRETDYLYLYAKKACLHLFHIRVCDLVANFMETIEMKIEFEKGNGANFLYFMESSTWFVKEWGEFNNFR